MVAPNLVDVARAQVEDHDDVVRLHGVTWADYERLLEIRGESAVPRYTYLEGELDIMNPSHTHESVKSVIGCLVEVWCQERGIEFETLGSWTLKNQAAERGAEPDECYVFGDRPEAEYPDLAIEVQWTRGGLDKLEVYRKLGVRELWYWSKGRIQVHELRGEHYAPIASSRLLAGIDLELLASLVERKPTSRAVREYRAALRVTLGPRGAG
jgi:Uma2 family endonuclease